MTLGQRHKARYVTIVGQVDQGSAAKNRLAEVGP
jgi:hypothetical protein